MLRRAGFCSYPPCVDPPVYGDSPLGKYKQRRRNNNGPSEKLHNTPRSDRSNNTDRSSEKWDECKSRSWRKNVPLGAGVCFDADVVTREATISREFHDCRRRVEKGEKETIENCLMSLAPTPSVQLWMPRGHCSRNTVPRGKKVYYNMMWDPRVCRGPTSQHFSIRQKEKCEKEMDMNKWMHFRSTRKKKLEKLQEREGGFLDKKMDPVGRILYPTVTLKKEPLSYSQYKEFLWDNKEKPKSVDKAQCMALDEDIDEIGRSPKGINVWVGPSAGCQTDIEPCKRDTEEWIVDTLVEKVPEQALLECTEEDELEVIRGERQRYETVFLFRKWQEMKEAQWQAWLYAWNEIRMNAILQENKDIEEKAERLSLIGFVKNAVEGCFTGTSQKMKKDGFINEYGIPYEEIKAVEEIFNFEQEFPKQMHGKKRTADKILVSILTQAVVERFAEHMHDEFGKPYGTWVKRGGKNRRASIQYDLQLQKYLEGRWTERREGHFGSLIRSVKTDLNLPEFLNDDDMPHNPKVDRLKSLAVERMYSMWNIMHREKMEGQPDEKIKKDDMDTPPPTPNSSIFRNLHKIAFGDGPPQEHRDSFQDGFAVLFKRDSEAGNEGPKMSIAPRGPGPSRKSRVVDKPPGGEKRKPSDK